MEFIDYKNLLESKNILLYDAQYRISYQRMKDLNKSIFNQNGGGSNRIIIDPFHVIKFTNKNKIIEIVNSLLNKNINKACKLCKYIH